MQNRLQLLTDLIALAMFSDGAHRAAPAERRRFIVIGLATALGSTSQVYMVFGYTGLYSAVQEAVAEAAQLLMAIGLVYAIVVDRLFDIAFVVNRAVVYAVTSALVVLAFVVIEWLVGRTATSFGHVQGAVVELGLAIAVAISLRPVHGYVDAFVDNAIFAARHRSANALLRFADDCGEFRTAEALFSATLDMVRTFARVSRCEIYVADEEGDLALYGARDDVPVKISADDVTVVRLKTSRAAIERSGFPPLTFADIAFPMLRRRALVGALCCTLPERAEPYSPEEREALACVAREVASSLIALEAANAQRLLMENAELRTRLAFERA